MSSNRKVINYKVLDLVILYNFDIKLDFIPRSYEKVMIFCVELFVGAGHTIT